MKNTPVVVPEPAEVGYGPAPARVAHSLSESQSRCLAALSEGSRTVIQVAEGVGLHPNMARRHLRTLAEQGLVDETSKQAGRGRPPIEYTLTAAGRGALAGQVGELGDDYRRLTEAFAIHLAQRGAHAASEARAIGRSWGTALAQAPERLTGRGRRGKLVGLLARLGFSPVIRGRDEVALLTCPLLDAARTHPEIVCQVHLGLVQGADEQLGGQGSAARIEPFAEIGCCRLRFRA